MLTYVPVVINVLCSYRDCVGCVISICTRCFLYSWFFVISWTMWIGRPTQDYKKVQQKICLNKNNNYTVLIQNDVWRKITFPHRTRSWVQILPDEFSRRDVLRWVIIFSIEDFVYCHKSGISWMPFKTVLNFL
jgi:hypothetical protein